MFIKEGRLGWVTLSSGREAILFISYKAAGMNWQRAPFLVSPVSSRGDVKLPEDIKTRSYLIEVVTC